MTNIVRLTSEPRTSTIDEADVNVARLASVLDAAVIEYTIDDDGDIYVSDGLEFPAWISIDEDKKLITFLTFFDPECVPQNVYFRINEINKTIVIVQFTWHSNRMWGQYWMSFDDGLNVKHLIKMLRRFTGAYRLGVDRLKNVDSGVASWN